MNFPKSRPAKSFDFTTIIYEKVGHRATITLNRPDCLNAVDFTMLRELRDAIEDVSWDDSIRVLVLTGAGDRAFCTGADLKEQHEYCLDAPDDYWKWMGAFIEVHEKLRNIGKPTVARLNGIVVGGGNEMNMSCDLAIAADDIYIRQVGAARGSVAAAGATQWLPIIVGDRRAREILMLCEDIPAAKALEWGLINQAVPRAELDAAVDAICDKLIDKLPECMRYTKQQLNYWRDMSWHQTIGHAKEWLSLHNMSREVHEGTRAFVEKRPVNYAEVRAAPTTDV
jgi:enoyl-CoA hydratase/carnithine racemase